MLSLSFRVAVFRARLEHIEEPRSEVAALADTGVDFRAGTRRVTSRSHPEYENLSPATPKRVSHYFMAAIGPNSTAGRSLYEILSERPKICHTFPPSHLGIGGLGGKVLDRLSLSTVALFLGHPPVLPSLKHRYGYMMQIILSASTPFCPWGRPPLETCLAVAYETENRLAVIA